MNKHGATLVSWTLRPMQTAFWAFKNMHNPITSNIEPFKDATQKTNFLKTLLEIPHKTVLEFVNTVWLINGSRAFQQQLTRTRNAAYSIQSLRIVNVGSFAEDGNYYTPPAARKGAYKEYMIRIQNMYNKIIEEGHTVESARGILPLNINSPITMAINLRDLLHMLELRQCENTQKEYLDIASDMKTEIINKIDVEFGEMFIRRPCEVLGHCNSPAPCYMVPRKYECKAQYDPASIGLQIGSVGK